MPPNPTPREPLAEQLRQAATELERDHHDLDDDGLCGLCDDDVPCWYTRTADVMRAAADTLTRTQAVVEASVAYAQSYHAMDTILSDDEAEAGEQFAHIIDTYHMARDVWLAAVDALAATHPAGGSEAMCAPGTHNYGDDQRLGPNGEIIAVCQRCGQREIVPVEEQD